MQIESLKNIGNIYISWRKGTGDSRRLIGVIKKNASEGVRFNYIESTALEAVKDGFTPFADFPDIQKTYSDNVLEIFGKRLVKADRTDIQKHYGFWEIDAKYADDKYYLLAYTQGILSTDNFEFLADFLPKKGLNFITEITGLSIRKKLPDTVMVNDELEWIREPNNPYDSNAIQVFKNKELIGYVKQVHNRVFSKSYHKLRIVVKSIDQNDYINRIFIRVSF